MRAFTTELSGQKAHCGTDVPQLAYYIYQTGQAVTVAVTALLGMWLVDLGIGVAARRCAHGLVIENAMASSVGFRVFPLGCVVGFLIGALGFFGFVIGLVLLYLKGASPPLLSFFFTLQFVCSLGIQNHDEPPIVDFRGPRKFGRRNPKPRNSLSGGWRPSDGK